MIEQIADIIYSYFPRGYYRDAEKAAKKIVELMEEKQ